MVGEQPENAAPRSYVAEWLMGNESLVAARTHLLLDAVEEAVTRHADVHPHRVADCEMCQFRGRVATAVLLNEPWEAPDGT